jgi:rhodanese-related sulfurtransferase
MADIGEIEPKELRRRLDRDDRVSVLDVREPSEVAIAPFPGSINVPMGDIPSRIGELDPDAEWVVVCHHGIRSAQVAIYLARNGFERVSNLRGGIEAWSLDVDPTVPRY